uniref:Uncharacterized protein n=1 Tax=Oryza barthii TaxID=65489 RepID=A0A0D3GPS3_9ORYZ
MPLRHNGQREGETGGIGSVGHGGLRAQRLGAQSIGQGGARLGLALPAGIAGGGSTTITSQNPNQKLDCLGELLILGEGAAARSSPKQESAWRGRPRSCKLGAR